MKRLNATRIATGVVTAVAALGAVLAAAPAAQAAPPEWTPYLLVLKPDARGNTERYYQPVTPLGLDPANGSELIPGGRSRLQVEASANDVLYAGFGPVTLNAPQPARYWLRYYKCAGPNIAVANCTLLKETTVQANSTSFRLGEPWSFLPHSYTTTSADVGSWIVASTIVRNSDQVASLRTRKAYIAPQAPTVTAPTLAPVAAGSPATASFGAWVLPQGANMRVMQREVKAWACVPSVIEQGQRLDGNPLCQQLLSQVLPGGVAAANVPVTIPAGSGGARVVLNDRLLVSVPQPANPIAPSAYVYQRSEAAPILVP